MSDLDRAYGYIFGAIVAIKMAGEELFPIADKLIKYRDILWGVQIRTLGLPDKEPAPMLGCGESNVDESANSDNE